MYIKTRLALSVETKPEYQFLLISSMHNLQKTSGDEKPVKPGSRYPKLALMIIFPSCTQIGLAFQKQKEMTESTLVCTCKIHFIEMLLVQAY